MPPHNCVEGTGRPVVVLPSLSLDSTAMRAAFEPAFAGVSGWSRVYLDLPGSGESPPGEPTSDAVLEDVIATVGALLGGEPFPIAGWSYGGYRAAAMLAANGPYENLGRFPHADYVLAAEAGHFLPVEQPGLFGAAVRTWLDRCRALRHHGRPAGRSRFPKK